MDLVSVVYCPTWIAERVIMVRARRGRSWLRENAIETNSCGNQQALMEILIASVAILESPSLHPCDGCEWENVNVVFRLHLDAASMLTPWQMLWPIKTQLEPCDAHANQFSTEI
jgi:hypothetical protein